MYNVLYIKRGSIRAASSRELTISFFGVFEPETNTFTNLVLKNRLLIIQKWQPVHNHPDTGLHQNFK
jgi:hypothetical protein